MTKLSPRFALARPIAIALLAIIVPFCIEGAVVVANLHWYGGLVKPSFAPPPRYAAPLCGVPGLLLAWGFFRILRRPDYLPDRPGAVRSLWLLLAFGLAWAWAFFASRHPSLGLVAAAAAMLVSGIVVWRFARVDGMAGWLATPAMLATTFAALIELSISLKNG